MAKEGGGREGQTFVGAIVKVHEVLFEFCGEGRGIDCVAVVLRSDVALSSRQVQSRDVVSAVSVLELDGSSTSCEGKELMAKTDTHNWDLGGFHEAGQMVDCFLAMGWVTRAVRDENAVEVVGDFVDGEIVGEDSDACSAADQAAKNVLLDTTVDDCYVHVSVHGTDVEWSLGADLLD
jgi:hypothetical protein